MSDETISMICDGIKRETAVANVKAAQNLYNYAGVLLELERTRERAAEVQSTAPSNLAKGKIAERFGDLSPRESDIFRAVSRYVISGRTDLSPHE